MSQKKADTKYREMMGKLMSIMRDHKSVVDSYVSETNLHKSQHRLLMTLSFMGDHVSQRDLAEKLNITPAAVAVTLKKLEKNGLVSKNTAEKDNRYNEVVMTQKGKRIVIESKKVFQYADEKMFRGFSDKDLKTLDGFLDRIRENLGKEKV